MTVEQPKNGTGVGWLALFASTGTLLCCALPILLVTLGFGSIVAAVTFRFPWLVAMVDYKPWMFGVSVVLLAFAVWMEWGRAPACPADPVLAAHCARAHIWNRRILWSAFIILGIGLFSSYGLLPLRNGLGY